MKFRNIVLTIAACLLSPMWAEAQEAPIRPSDRIVLRISGVPAEDQNEVAGEYPVSDGGSIRLPYIGEVKAVGSTPSLLARAVERAYINAEIYTMPTVTIAPAAGLTETRRITVIGEVRSSGQVSFQDGMTLLEAVASAGGPNEFANTRQIKIIRNGQITVHDLRDISRRPELDPALVPGDRIIVPK